MTWMANMIPMWPSKALYLVYVIIWLCLLAIYSVKTQGWRGRRRPHNKKHYRQIKSDEKAKRCRSNGRAHMKATISAAWLLPRCHLRVHELWNDASFEATKCGLCDKGHFHILKIWSRFEYFLFCYLQLMSSYTSAYSWPSSNHLTSHFIMSLLTFCSHHKCSLVCCDNRFDYKIQKTTASPQD